MSRYKSNAKWTKMSDSYDVHDTEEFAKAICERLLEEYGTSTQGCEIRGKCLKTWVTKEKTQ